MVRVGLYHDPTDAAAEARPGDVGRCGEAWGGVGRRGGGRGEGGDRTAPRLQSSAWVRGAARAVSRAEREPGGLDTLHTDRQTGGRTAAAGGIPLPYTSPLPLRLAQRSRFGGSGGVPVCVLARASPTPLSCPCVLLSSTLGGHSSGIGLRAEYADMRAGGRYVCRAFRAPREDNGEEYSERRRARSDTVECVSSRALAGRPDSVFRF